eukprot:6123170-Pyramimonas_sp.AAC.1
MATAGDMSCYAVSRARLASGSDPSIWASAWRAQCPSVRSARVAVRAVDVEMDSRGLCGCSRGAPSGARGPT